MILTLFSKNWKLLIDIVIVLGIIFLVFWWNPFNLFGAKLELKDTANMVSKVRDIGELVTAEYYGEVLATDDEARRKVQNTDSILRLGEEHYKVIKQELMRRYVYRQGLLKEELAKHPNWKPKRKRAFRENFEKDSRKRIVKNSLEAFPKMLPTEFIRNSTMLFVGHYEHGTKIKDKKYVRKDEDSNYVNRIWTEVLELEYDRIKRQYNGDLEFINYDQQGFRTNASYVDFYFHYSRLEQPKKERKVKLAMIGRGSVQAGFRFDKLGDNNVVYDDRNQTVYFFGFQAEILSADINPWFIPQRGIPGFEILKEEDAQFRHVRELKIHCIDKLRENALAADILEQAQRNGEEAMKEFFTLLLGEDVKRIVFKKDPLPQFEQKILDDSVISWDEVAIIDSLISRQLLAIEEEEVEAIHERRKTLTTDFIRRLKKYPLVLENGTRFDFNYTTKALAGVMRDSLFTKTELHEVMASTRLNPVSHPDFPKPPPAMALWYDWELDYLYEFNFWMDLMLTNGLVNLEEVVNEPSILPSDSVKRIAALKRAKEFVDKEDSLFYRVIGAEIKYFRMKGAPIPAGIKYPISEAVDFEKYAMKAGKWKTKVTKDTLTVYPYNEVMADTALYATHRYDSIFTDWTDSTFLIVNRDSTFVLLRDSIVLDTVTYAEVKSGKSIKKILDSNYMPSGHQLEIQKIRDYLKAKRRAEKNLGPVIRLRRDFDRWVGNDSTGTISGVKKTLQGWRERWR